MSESEDKPTQALATTAPVVKNLPTNEAIVRRYADLIAKSPTAIQRGQAVFLDKHGMPFGRTRYERLVRMWRGAIWGGLIATVGLAVAGAWLPAALVYLGATSPIWWSKYRGAGHLMAIDVLIRQGELEEAQRRFDAVSTLRRRNRGPYCYLAGNLASHRGRYAEAIKWWREAQPHLNGVGRELVKLYIVKALVLSGEMKQAVLAFEDVKFPPEADEVLTGQLLAKVMFALLGPSGLPDSEQLHDWARAALGYSHAGVELAAIGWAFERAGDTEMARFLAREAVDRMHYPYLATWWPALQQWLDSQQGGEPADLSIP